jgi:hypothetical protein
VIIPFSGETPEAIPKAIAKGRATMPTIIPDIRSAINVFLEYSFDVVTNFGLNSTVFIFNRDVKKYVITRNAFGYTQKRSTFYFSLSTQ